MNFGKTLDYSHSEPTHPVEHVATAREVSLRESYFSNPDKFFTSIVSVSIFHIYSNINLLSLISILFPPLVMCKQNIDLG